MTFEEREAIFAKEALTNEDIAKLFECSIPKASQIAHEIKRKVGSRIKFEGRVHVQDYLDFMEIKQERIDMYRKPPIEVEMPKKSVCWGGQV